MEAILITTLICSFVCGGVLLEALAPHLPALLGLGPRPESAAGGSARPLSTGRFRGRAADRGLELRDLSEGDMDRLAELERRMEDLRAERDFYRALAERPGGGSGGTPEDGDPNR